MKKERASYSKVPDIIKEIMSGQNLGVLSTCGEEYPYSSLVGFAVCDEYTGILFATSRMTHKYAYMQTDPKVSILIDTETNSGDDFFKAHAITVLGQTQELQAKEKSQYGAVFLKKFPQLKDFLSAPTCALMYMSVHIYRLVSRFQEVSEYRLY